MPPLLHLRILPALPCHILHIKVDIDLQPGVLKQLQHDIRHQQFIPLAVSKFMILVIGLCQNLAQAVRTAPGTK